MFFLLLLQNLKIHHSRVRKKRKKIFTNLVKTCNVIKNKVFVFDTNIYKYPKLLIDNFSKMNAPHDNQLTNKLTVKLSDISRDFEQ